MITSVELDGAYGGRLVFPMVVDLSSPYFVKEIKGVGPAKASVTTSRQALLPGDVVTGISLGGRNIVIDLQFNPYSDVESARLATYTAFPIGTRIGITLNTEKRKLHTYGIMEANEPTIFSQRPGTQISILCPDTYFTNAFGYEIIDFASSTEPKLEFEFSNESLTQRLIEVSTFVKETEREVINAGDEKTGFEAIFKFTGEVTNPMIYNAESQDYIRVLSTKIVSIYGSGIKNGDILRVSTVKGSKGAWFTRDNVETNIFDALDLDNLTWLELIPGVNKLGYSAASGMYNMSIQIKYPVLYGGA